MLARASDNASFPHQSSDVAATARLSSLVQRRRGRKCYFCFLLVHRLRERQPYLVSCQLETGSARSTAPVGLVHAYIRTAIALLRRGNKVRFSCSRGARNSSSIRARERMWTIRAQSRVFSNLHCVRAANRLRFPFSRASLPRMETSDFSRLEVHRLKEEEFDAPPKHGKFCFLLEAFG